MGLPPRKEGTQKNLGQPSPSPRRRSKGLLPVRRHPAQTMREGGFCLLKAVLSSKGMSSFFGDDF
ncbi:Hypothetical protein FKW44_003696 [Caligus rogercresseyi]|uniref:Uncharacterized protein n=1 Tax=Caligus rogercresseyi TaxID=217165 RepID=A0A7T8KLZ8_CALRO|nr:Hypothetical protein FKW44_003696 [Caligus rogercresseyi]